MSRLELNLRPNTDWPQVSVLTLGGDLNLSTLAQLESALAALKQQGRLKVVVDLKDLQFISSSGLGAFLATVNHFRADAGDLVFVHLSPKIQKVFAMVGFLRVLSVVPTVEEAMAHFTEPERSGAAVAFSLAGESDQHSGRPFPVSIEAVDASGRVAKGYQGMPRLRPEWGIVSPVHVGPFKEGRWSGSVILTGPGEVQLRVVDQGVEGSHRFNVLESRAKTRFPADTRCPGCAETLTAPESNVFRCRRCGEVLLVDEWGQAITLRPGASGAPTPLVYQLLVPSDVNVLGQLRGFCTGLLRDAGYEPGFVDDVELALDEALANVVEHAYEYDPSQTIAVRLTLEQDLVSVLIKDTGKTFDRNALKPVDLEHHLKERKPGGLGRFLMEKVMDVLEYSASQDGNILMMMKRVRPKG